MQEIRQRTGEWVSATVQENIWAGAGAGVLTFVLGYALRGYSNALVIATVLVGAGFFGLLCVIRFTADERRMVWDKHMQRTAEDTIIELEATVTGLRAELRRVEIELRTDEFRRAGRNAKVVVAADAQAELRGDVENVIARWAKGAKFGRDHCEIGRSRWEKATSLLVHSGAMVVSSDGRKQRVFADGMTPEKSEARVRDAFDRIGKHKNTNFTPTLS